MSADLLRRAAAKAREVAEAATSGPWSANSKRDDRKLGLSVDVGGNVTMDPDTNRKHAHLVATTWGMGGVEQNAAHIALWHPAVALAVADLLDLLSEIVDDFSDDLDGAVRLARLLLGEDA